MPTRGVNGSGSGNNNTEGWSAAAWCAVKEDEQTRFSNRGGGNANTQMGGRVCEKHTCKLKSRRKMKDKIVRSEQANGH